MRPSEVWDLTPVEILTYADIMGETAQDEKIQLAGYIGIAFNDPRRLAKMQEDIKAERRIRKAGEVRGELGRFSEFFHNIGVPVKEKE